MSDGDLRRRSSEIELAASDTTINELLGRTPGGEEVATAAASHFDQAEEFFIKLPQPVEVPAFAIHHDVRQRRPSRDYQQNLRRVVEQITAVVPSLLGGSPTCSTRRTRSTPPSSNTTGCREATTSTWSSSASATAVATSR